MTRDELYHKLKEIRKEQLQDSWFDAEENHKEADAALLEYIDDVEITKAFEKIEKWYA
jgi:hypothetical protein